VFEKRVLRRIFGYKGEELTGDAEDCKMRIFITCSLLTHSMVQGIL
jgi:hypothetical protein